jgi:hypothetical protein
MLGELNMRFPFIQDPATGQPSEFVTLSVLVTFAVVFRFLVDGMTFHIFSHVITFVKLDSMTYVSLLGPVLGAHSFIKTRDTEEK